MGRLRTPEKQLHSVDPACHVLVLPGRNPWASVSSSPACSSPTRLRDTPAGLLSTSAFAWKQVDVVRHSFLRGPPSRFLLAVPPAPTAVCVSNIFFVSLGRPFWPQRGRRRDEVHIFSLLSSSIFRHRPSVSLLAADPGRQAVALSRPRKSSVTPRLAWASAKEINSPSSELRPRRTLLPDRSRSASEPGVEVAEAIFRHKGQYQLAYRSSIVGSPGLTP